MAAFDSLDVHARWSALTLGGLISVGRPILDFAILSAVVTFGQGREMPEPPGALGKALT
jgi:hypothetical protein